MNASAPWKFGYDRLEEALEQRREDDDQLQAIREGWYLGDQDFKQELLEQMQGRAGPSHYGEAVREAAEARAQKIVAEELARRRWDEKTLRARRKGDPGKIVIAERLRKETTVSLGWIVERLQMGTKTHLAHLLYWSRRGGKRA